MARSEPRTARVPALAAKVVGMVGMLGMVGTGVLAPTVVGAAVRVSTATVERRDLVDRENVNGTLGYGETTDVASPRPGVLTRLPAAGTVIERGQAVFDVNAQGVPLLYGDLPMYRSLSIATGDGADIRQLEENLAALGFSDGLSIDDDFDAATADAVRDWQESLGLTRTGVVETSDAVIAPGPLRIAERIARKGAQVGPGGPVVKTTGTARVVTVRLEVTRQSLATPDAPAQVVLPDGRLAAGRITVVGTTATKDSEQSAPKIDVTVALVDPAAAGSLTEAPVTVRLTKSTAEDVLTVPVGALLALSEGGYAVEVKRNGRTTLVEVEVGAFADGMVEITGSVRAGDRVVVPA